jgi:arylsulfatase A-like enzyme
MRFTICLTTLCLLFCSVVTAASPPNIVLILADDIAWTDYGFAGHEHIKTPHLDALAKESLRFTRGYVPSSLCRPSLMSLITGLYPHEHKVTGNDPRGDRKTEPREPMLKHVDRLPTLPKLLSEKGYVSHQSGKWWEGNFARGGFTHGMTHGNPAKGGRHGDLGLKIGREGITEIKEFVKNNENKPFFLWYAPILPHQPHNPPERLLAKYRDKTPSLHVAKYWAMVEWFDETCGELLKFLDDSKLGDNTLVYYIADNGWIQDPNKPIYDPRSKQSRFDAGLRTQVLLRWRGKIAPRVDDTTLVSSIDFVPTMLAASGLETTAKFSGVNLLPLACENKPLTRDTLYGAIFYHDVPDIDDPTGGLKYRWCLQNEYKLITSAEDSSIELYNVLNDVTEEKNIAEEHPDKVAALKTKLNAWWPDKTIAEK